MFITFEGIEGSGKTTQIKLLAKTLEAQGHAVVLTREPGGTKISDQIRKILVEATNKDMVPTCELLLYYASRAQHLEEFILPSLKKNKIVLCDRFTDATLAYQGFARGMDVHVLETLGQIVLKGLKPDLTFLFDLPVEIGLKRAKARARDLAAEEREDRFENELLSFHEKVRQGYLKIAKGDPQRFRILDATKSKHELHEKILQVVQVVLK